MDSESTKEPCWSVWLGVLPIAKSEERPDRETETTRRGKRARQRRDKGNHAWRSRRRRARCWRVRAARRICGNEREDFPRRPFPSSPDVRQRREWERGARPGGWGQERGGGARQRRRTKRYSTEVARWSRARPGAPSVQGCSSSGSRRSLFFFQGTGVAVCFIQEERSLGLARGAPLRFRGLAVPERERGRSTETA